MLTIASLTATAAQAVTSETPLRELAASAGIFVGAAANYLYLTGSEAECQWENCRGGVYSAVYCIGCIAVYCMGAVSAVYAQRR